MHNTLPVNGLEPLQKIHEVLSPTRLPIPPYLLLSSKDTTFLITYNPRNKSCHNRK